MGNCWHNKPAASNITTPPSSVHKTVKNNRPSPAANRGGGRVDAIPPSGDIVTPDLKMFTYADLRSATRDFRLDMVLGEGGFGRVYKGYVDEKTLAPSRFGVGIPVAVKRSNPESEQGLKEWQAEVKFLGKFSHPNLVKLLGYCWEEKQFLLVYECMENGSLENHLFTKHGSEQISWDIRIKIAIGAARGLSVLHNTEKTVIYRDFKASNILLDREFNAKLSDFGLAKLGPIDGNTHVTTNVVGTYGYAAPEYIATGHVYVKSDVYGFGVVLLEIMTGLRVFDPNRPGNQINLVDWARPSLPHKNKVQKLMDPLLQGDYPLQAAHAMAKLILKCIEPDPKSRPDMDSVLDTLKQISGIQKKPKKLKAGPKQHLHHHHPQRPPPHSYHGGGGGAAPLRQHKEKTTRSY